MNLISLKILQGLTQKIISYGELQVFLYFVVIEFQLDSCSISNMCVCVHMVFEFSTILLFQVYMGMILIFNKVYVAYAWALQQARDFWQRALVTLMLDSLGCNFKQFELTIAVACSCWLWNLQGIWTTIIVMFHTSVFSSFWCQYFYFLSLQVLLSYVVIKYFLKTSMSLLVLH